MLKVYNVNISSTERFAVWKINTCEINKPIPAYKLLFNISSGTNGSLLHICGKSRETDFYHYHYLTHYEISRAESTRFFTCTRMTQ